MQEVRRCSRREEGGVRSEDVDVDVIGEKKKLQLNREYITYFVNNEIMERSYFSRSFSQYICTFLST